jgi:hypothetical protein
MDSITLVVGSPRVFGLRGDSTLYVQVRQTSTMLINDQRILFMCQVDNFAIASPDAKTADILWT